MAIVEKKPGPDHPNAATLVNNLGGVPQDLGDLAGARAAYEQVPFQSTLQRLMAGQVQAGMAGPAA